VNVCSVTAVVSADACPHGTPNETNFGPFGLQSLPASSIMRNHFVDQIIAGSLATSNRNDRTAPVESATYALFTDDSPFGVFAFVAPERRSLPGDEAAAFRGYCERDS
jgi:hypothetical protein